MDIRLPKLSGIEVVRRLKGCSPNTKALIVTLHDEDTYILASREASAAGYFLKTASATDLVEAIRSVQLGKLVCH